MPTETNPSGGEIILYQSEDGQARIQCRLVDETPRRLNT